MRCPCQSLKVLINVLKEHTVILTEKRKMGKKIDTTTAPFCHKNIFHQKNRIAMERDPEKFKRIEAVSYKKNCS